MILTRKSVSLAAGSLLLGAWLGAGTGVSGAASPSQRTCEAAEGTFTKVNGTVTCVITTSDPVGNSESSGGKSQTRDTTTTDGGQGNLRNKETSSSTCSGPGNSSNC